MKDGQGLREIWFVAAGRNSPTGVTVAAAMEGTVAPDHHGKKNAVGSGTATSGTLLAIPLGPRISLESTITIRLGRQSHPDTRRNPDEGGL